MMTNNPTAEDIKCSLDLVKVIESNYGYRLNRDGSEYKGAISATSKSGKSLNVNPEKQVYNDFAGNAGSGDVFNFIAQEEGLDIKHDFPEVLRIAAEMAGIAIDSNIDYAAVEEKRDLQTLFRIVFEHYHSCLNDRGRQYINDKWGIRDNTIDEQLIGWAPTDSSLLQVPEITDYFSHDLLKKSGLFYCNSNDSLEDIYRGRLVFPYWKRDSIAYSIGRDPTWDGNTNQRKFIKQLVHSDKRPYISRVVENIIFGQDSIRGHDTIYITEGIADAIVLLQNGLPVISPVTTRIKAADIEKVVAACKGKKLVKIVNDNETNNSGLNGAIDTAHALEAAGINAYIVQLPREDGQDKIDVAEYMLTHTKADIEQLPYMRAADMLLQALLNEADKTTPILTRISRAKAAFKQLQSLPNSERVLGSKEVWKAYGLELKAFDSAYSEVFDSLTPAEATDSGPVENDVLDIYTDEIKGYARDILENGDPFEIIHRVIDKYHVGDDNIKKLCMISYATCHLTTSQGLQLKPAGPSGKGKTHVFDNVALVLPSHRVFRGSMSGMGAYYNGQRLKDGMVFLLDDTDLNRTEGLKNTIKRAASNFQNRTTHLTVVKGAGKAVELPARPIWWISSVRGIDDDQLGNRFIPVDIDGSEEQDQRVYDWQKQQHLIGLPPDQDIDVQVCRCIYDILGKDTYKVVVPFLDAITWANTDNRRNYPMFLDIVMGITFHYLRQRERVDGAYVATVADCQKAIEIYSQIEQQNASNLTADEEALVAWLGDTFRYGTWQDRIAIQNFTGKCDKAVRDMLHGEDGNGGLLAKVPELQYYKGRITEDDGKKTRDKAWYSMTKPHKARGTIVSLDTTAADIILKAYSTTAGPRSSRTVLVPKKYEIFSLSAEPNSAILVPNCSIVCDDEKEIYDNGVGAVDVPIFEGNAVKQENTTSTKEVGQPNTKISRSPKVRDTTSTTTKQRTAISKEKRQQLLEKIPRWEQGNFKITVDNIPRAVIGVANLVRETDTDSIKNFLLEYVNTSPAEVVQ